MLNNPKTETTEVIYQYIKAETSKAWLMVCIDYLENEKDIWFPKSICHIIDEGDEGQGIINCPVWFAEEHDLF